MIKKNLFNSIVIIFVHSLYSFSASSAEYSFDTNLLGLSPDNVDINYILNNEVKPGIYSVDLFINNYQIEGKDINFLNYQNGINKNEVLPCLQFKDMESWGIDMRKIKYVLDYKNKCVFITERQIKVEFSVNSRQLKLSVPQLFLSSTKKDIVPIELWDDGIPAMLLNYNIGEKNTKYNSFKYSYKWARLMPGFNVGAWRFRNYSFIEKDTFTSTQWHNESSYLERGFYNIKSRLVIGKKITPGEIFSSLPFTGVMFGTDESMVPFSDRQYSPIVRGIAKTSARVEVKQNGYTVYNTNVPPGPFEFSDIPQVQNGGSLDIIVWESDGSTQQFTVPYQIPAIALHQGYLNYNFMSGRYSSAYAKNQNLVSQMTLMYGFPADFSGYGGIQVAKNYQSMSLGIGKSLGVFGGVSLDTTSSRVSYSQKKVNGQMWRLRYNNTLDQTNTSFGITHSLLGASYIDAGNFFEGDPLSYPSSSNRMSTSFQVAQSITNLGAFSFTYQMQNNKNFNSSDNYNFSWSSNFKYFSISAGWQNSKIFYTRVKSHRKENIFSLFFTIPLESWFENNLQATWNIISRSNKIHEQQFGLKGQSFDRQLVWDISEVYRKDQNNILGSMANLEWSGRYGKVRANYSESRNSNSLGFSVDGGVILHSNGLTIGQPFTNSVALTEALGAAGAAVGGWPGIRTDLRGYTLLPNLNNYQINSIKLDNSTLSNNVEILNNEKRVTPTSGAIVKVKFNAIIGIKAIIKIKNKKGNYLPLGSQVYIKGKETIAGLIDSDGQVYLSGLNKSSRLNIKYLDEKCTISNLELKDNTEDYLQKISAICL